VPTKLMSCRGCCHTWAAPPSHRGTTLGWPRSKHGAAQILCRAAWQ
jgi:hypothetical protein